MKENKETVTVPLRLTKNDWLISLIAVIHTVVSVAEWELKCDDNMVMISKWAMFASLFA